MKDIVYTAAFDDDFREWLENPTLHDRLCRLVEQRALEALRAPWQSAPARVVVCTCAVGGSCITLHVPLIESETNIELLRAIVTKDAAQLAS